MKKMLMVVMACYAFTARSQADQSKNFIYLYSDSVIYANDVSLRPDYPGSWRLRADRRNLPIVQVKFVNNEDGFFANTRKLKFTGLTGFAERTIEGKINLYREINYDPESYNWRYGHPEETNPSVDIRNYYNKGFGDLKRINYNNLQADMADHIQSMDLLKSYRKTLVTRNIFYGAAGASFVAGFVSLLTSKSGFKSSNDGFMNHPSTIAVRHPNFLPMTLLFGAGIGFGLGGTLLHFSSSRKLKDAIEIYNK
jgi:hypothetical protein